jgi:hypothetical protein
MGQLTDLGDLAVSPADTDEVTSNMDPQPMSPGISLGRYTRPRTHVKHLVWATPWPPSSSKPPGLGRSSD